MGKLGVLLQTNHITMRYLWQVREVYIENVERIPGKSKLDNLKFGPCRISLTRIFNEQTGH
jgi:hypothetical protein